MCNGWQKHLIFFTMHNKLHSLQLYLNKTFYPPAVAQWKSSRYMSVGYWFKSSQPEAFFSSVYLTFCVCVEHSISLKNKILDGKTDNHLTKIECGLHKNNKYTKNTQQALRLHFIPNILPPKNQKRRQPLPSKNA